MKKLEQLIDFFDFKKSTFFVLFFSFLTGKGKNIVLFLGISFLHELGHLLACCCFKVKLKKMNILPFGFNLEIDKEMNVSILKELIIYLSGPSTYFFISLLLSIFYQQQKISEVTFLFAKNANLVINLFNLLPIYPLDGFRVMNCAYQYFFSYRYSLKIATLTSISFFVFLIIKTIVQPQIVIVLFLFVMQIKFIKEIPHLYKLFLIKKTFYKKHKRYIILKKMDMYKERNNYYFQGNKILNDVEIAKKLLESD